MRTDRIDVMWRLVEVERALADARDRAARRYRRHGIVLAAEIAEIQRLDSEHRVLSEIKRDAEVSDEERHGW